MTMENQNKDLSLYFYHVLSHMIGTEDVVRRRRSIFKTFDFVYFNSWVFSITSGSKAEGLEMAGSDIDIMMCDKYVRVFEHSHNSGCHTQQHAQIIMNTENTKPGFASLKFNYLPFEDNCRMNKWCEDFGDGTYISSKRFRESFLAPDTIIHGPCVSSKDGHFDFLWCFQCHEWISEATPWIYRSRSSWPGNEVMQRIVNCGVLFAPIGCKGSPNEDLEWRISFSVSEKELIHSFNHVQLLCYALLKIILKDIIKKKHGDSICSYFLKTIMFWLCEENEQSNWIPDNFLICFMKCLKRLVYCVKYQTCLHYFIPENNFFEGRFTKNQYENLLSTLTSLETLGWRCILCTDTLQQFSNRMTSLPFMPRATFVHSLPMFRLLRLNVKKSHRKAVFGCLHSYRKDLYVNILSLLNQHLSHDIHDYPQSTNNNKQLYRQYKKCMSHCLIGINSDSVSGWLLLASLFYKHKEYHKCIFVIDYCLEKFTPEKIRMGINPDVAVQSFFQFNYEKYGLLPTLKMYTINPFIEFASFSYLIPTEMTHLCREIDGIIYIPCVVFGYLMNFLCLLKLNDLSGMKIAYEQLNTVVEKTDFLVNSNSIINTEECLELALGILTKKLF